MRVAVTLPVLAAAATAFVVPDARLFAEPDLQAQDGEAQHAFGVAADAAQGVLDYVSHCIQKTAAAGQESLEQIFAPEELLDGELDFAPGLEGLEGDSDGPHHPKHPHPPPPPPHHPPGRKPGKRPGGGDGDDGHDNHGLPESSNNLTIYQLISQSKSTSKFYKLVSKYESVVKILNSTSANFTLFVPTNQAFDRIPGHGDHKDGKKPSDKVIEAALKYHIAKGLYPAVKVLHSHTLPTTYEEEWLGNHPQRLRTRVGLFGGVRINFFSKVVVPNIRAKNGVIHAINMPLLPPPVVGRILSLVPQRFSSLLLAYNKTDFVSYVHNLTMTGSTVFAPTNNAFERLGPKANAFLFNTKTGLKYLKALLKYHIVANATLYSDAYYDGDKGDKGNSSPENDDDDQARANRHYHVDLPTLLGKGLSIDINRWGGWIRMKINGYVNVSVRDVIAKNGVIQVVSRVLVPLRKPRGAVAENDADNIEVEDLKERFSEYLDEEDGEKGEDDWNEL